MVKVTSLFIFELNLAFSFNYENRQQTTNLYLWICFQWKSQIFWYHINGCRYLELLFVLIHYFETVVGCFGFFLLYSKSLLVIHLKYSNVYMSIPNSLIILSPHPSPPATVSSFSKSAGLFLCGKQVHLYNFFLDFTYKGCCLIFLLLRLTYSTQYL